MRYAFSFVLTFFLFSPAIASEENPFLSVRERYQWAIEQVMEHKAPDVSWEGNLGGGNYKGNRRKTKLSDSAPTPTPYQTQVLHFESETDKAKVNATVTDFGPAFVIDVSSDQTIQGWLLKRQSTRDVFLRGTGPTDNPYQCRIRVDRPYIRDFGLTVYVTQDSDPAFIQLF